MEHSFLSTQLVTISIIQKNMSLVDIRFLWRNIRYLFSFAAVAKIDIFAGGHTADFFELSEEIGIVIESRGPGDFGEVPVAAPNQCVRIFDFVAVEEICERKTEMLLKKRCKIGFIIREAVGDRLQSDVVRVIPLDIENAFSDKVLRSCPFTGRRNGGISEGGEDTADRCNLIQLGVLILSGCQNAFQFFPNNPSDGIGGRQSMGIGAGSGQKRINDFRKTDTRYLFQLIGIQIKGIVPGNVAVRGDGSAVRLKRIYQEKISGLANI